MRMPIFHPAYIIAHTPLLGTYFCKRLFPSLFSTELNKDRTENAQLLVAVLQWIQWEGAQRTFHFILRDWPVSLEELIKEVGGMGKPTLLFSGAADSLVSHAGVVTMADWLKGEMVKVEGGSHYIEEEGRDAMYARIEQFLHTHSAADVLQ
jgi:pimeloyl-ACP methyl ester carboxylesterase